MKVEEIREVAREVIFDGRFILAVMLLISLSVLYAVHDTVHVRVVEKDLQEQQKRIYEFAQQIKGKEIICKGEFPVVIMNPRVVVTYRKTKCPIGGELIYEMEAFVVDRNNRAYSIENCEMVREM